MGERLPPFLGLIESRNAGKSWQPVSLLGRYDFHVLEAAGQRVYGFGRGWLSRREGLLVSSDGGRQWTRRPHPASLMSAAADPSNPDRIIASGGDALHFSSNAGRRWRQADGPPGFLMWPSSKVLYLVDPGGRVRLSEDGGKSWVKRGDVGGQPAAISGAGSELYVALHDGTVSRSADEGATWRVVSRR